MSLIASQFSTWQEALSQLITDPKELFFLLEIQDEYLLKAAYQTIKTFPLKVTHSFVARMEKKNLNDPLLRQVLPIDLELQDVIGYGKDPLNEANVNPVSGLLHKYHGRVLVTLTSACAIHCRYCFRRHFPYSENNPGRIGWEKIFAYIRNDVSINEVILSGGDPLAVSDKMLKLFGDEIEKIPHVKQLRIHTRIPIVLPQRITQEFIHWITQSALQIIIVVHANHPNEINDEVKNQLLRLKSVNTVLLNQSVLLKGINDDISVLTKLSQVLFSAGVLPYYLHVLDKVQGATHFDMTRNRAEMLYAQLAARLPGYLLPRFVCEHPGNQSKTVLSTALFTG